MIFITIRMKVSPGKRRELSQTIASLVPAIMTEEGCRACEFYYSMEDVNELFLFEAWESCRDFDSHRQSEIFKVLMGATSLLDTHYEIKLYSELPPPLADDPTDREGCQLPAEVSLTGNGLILGRTGVARE